MKLRRVFSLLFAAVVPTLAACGGASTSGNTGAVARPGAPISTFPAAVKSACQASNSPKIAEIQKRGTLQWGIGVSPPFGFKQPNGDWAGVEPDNANELAHLLGVSLQIQDYDYSLMTVVLRTDKADIVGAQLFATASRAQVIDFSHTYYLSGQLFYVLKDSKWQTIDDLNSPSDRFVYGTGGGQKDLAQKYIPKATVSDAPLRGQLLLYEFLASGQADSSMVEAAPMAVLFKKYQHPQLAAIGLRGRVTTAHAAPEDILSPFKVAFGLAKGDPGYENCINTWVDDMLTSGRMTQRLDYWLAQNIAG